MKTHNNNQKKKNRERFKLRRRRNTKYMKKQHTTIKQDIAKLENKKLRLS